MFGPLGALILMVALGLPSFAAGQETVLVPRADGRDTPVRLYGDWSAGACPPTVLLSHGLGGAEDGLAYLGAALSGLGMRVAVMGHRESGRRALLRSVIRRDKTQVLRDPASHAARVLDLEAALGLATRACRPALLVLGGHSMGAATTMLEAGARGKVPVRGADRFDAYIALSPQGVGWMFDAGAWAGIVKPVLMVTGTRDHGIDGAYVTRLAAFAGLPADNKRLAILDGATHADLGGRGSEEVQAVVASVVAGFLHQLGTTGALSPTAVPNVAITDK